MSRPVPAADGRYLRDLLDTPFTDEQLTVATAGLSPQLVVAGAGSGKTTVMAARVVHAVAFHRLAPSAVLGLTFTNKAAGQLTEAVRRALGRLAGSGALDPAALDDEPMVSTYHAYAAALVRDHALRIGREPLTTLLTEATRWQLAMRAVRSATGPFRHLTWTPGYVARQVLALDGEMSEHLCEVDDLRSYDAEVIRLVEALATPVKDALRCAEAASARDELLTLVADFRQRKALLDLVDHGDQVALAARIALAAPEVAAGERDRHRLVILDEYQDTGVAQRVLLTALYAGHPVTAVGDPHQAIYGWRGASVGNLLRFAEHFADDPGAVAPLALMTSFRCGGRVLTVANAIAEPLRRPVAGSRRPHLDVPVLAPVDARRDDGQVLAGLFHTVADEAAWVATQVAHAIHDEGVAPGEVAVLCRRRSDFPLLHHALLQHDLPVEVVGLGGLLEMPEVADVVATLRVMADPTANAAVVRLLSGPRWRIGPRDLAALGRRARRLADPGPAPESGPEAALHRAAESTDPVEVVSLLDALDSLGPADAFSPQAHARLTAFADELRELRLLAGQPVVEAVTEVVTRIGLDVEIEAAAGGAAEARAANLAAFLDHTAHFTGLDGASDLPSFLAFLDAAADAENGLDAGGVSAADTVKLLTVHKAKGLEWEVVAVPGLTTKVFPSGQGRSRWTAAAGVLPFARRGDRADLPPDPELTRPGLKAFKQACDLDDAAEERRLGYVAFTRARRRLLLSGYWWGAGRRTMQGPSTLLTEATRLAEQGVVEVVAWEAEPAAQNPLAEDTQGDVAWPSSYDPQAWTARRDAAARVHAALADLRAGAAPEQPVLSAGARDLVASWRAEAATLLAELHRRHGDVREVRLPRRLTTSQVVMLADDPDGLARQLARPMPAAPRQQARRGSRFHAWAESLYAERPLFDVDEVPGAGDADLTDAELVELQERFLAGGWAERTPVAVEAPFELVVGGRLLRGRIDAVYPRDDGGHDVIDFKTGAPPRDATAAALQLSVYRLAWAGITGLPPSRVSAGFLYVRTGELLRPPRLHDADELAALLAGEELGVDPSPRPHTP